MTEEQIRDMIADIIDNGSLDQYETAQAVIDALTPMMREFVGSIQDLMPLEIVQGDCFQRTNPHTKLMGNSSMAWAVSNGDRSAHKIRERIFTLSEALASLPDCWKGLKATSVSESKNQQNEKGA